MTIRRTAWAAAVIFAVVVVVLTATGWLRFGWGPEHRPPPRHVELRDPGIAS